MRTGVSSACFFGKMLTEDTLFEIAEIGAKNAEVFLNSPSEYDDRFTVPLKRRADSLGISIDSVHPIGLQYELQLFSTYQRAADDAREMYKKVLNAGKKLGAKYYIMHGGVFLKPRGPHKLNFKNVGKNIQLLSEMARDYGMSLAYENVYWCWYSYPTFADELLNEVKSDNLKFNLDIKQAALSGYDSSEYIDRMGERLANVHICGLRFEGDDIKTCLPSEGDFDMNKLKADLEKVAYDNNIIIELYSKDFNTTAELKASYDKIDALFSGRNSSI